MLLLGLLMDYCSLFVSTFTVSNVIVVSELEVVSLLYRIVSVKLTASFRLHSRLNDVVSLMSNCKLSRSNLSFLLHQRSYYNLTVTVI